MKYIYPVLIFLFTHNILFSQELGYYRYILKQEYPVVYNTISDDAFERCSEDARKYGNEVEIQSYCFLQIKELESECPDLMIKSQLLPFRWDLSENIEYAYQYGRIDWVEAYKEIFKSIVQIKHTPIQKRGKVSSF